MRPALMRRYVIILSLEPHRAELVAADRARAVRVERVELRLGERGRLAVDQQSPRSGGGDDEL